MAEMQQAEQRVQRVFERWAEANVRSVVWKSADRWSDGIAGKTDFDILVEPEAISAAMDVLVAENWIPVDAEPWRTFPGLFDFVTFEGTRCLHIHLHERIVSGEKTTKSLRPPLTELYLQSTREHAPAPIVRPELEFVLLIVRIVLKISWIDILGAIKRRSAFAVYRNYLSEYQPLRDECERSAVAGVLAAPELNPLPADLILASYDDLASLGWRERRALRRAIRTWRAFDLPGARPYALVRGCQRRLAGVGKRLPFAGVAIAVCGPDGSGKTTLVRELQEVLGQQLRVRRLYMGGNLQQPGKLRWLVMWGSWLPYMLARKACKIVGLTRAVAALESAYQGLDRRLMRGEKRRRLRSAGKAVERGEIVLFERYPLFHPFGDDMNPSVHLPPIPEAKQPDILVLLDIDPETAFARRANEPRDLLTGKVNAFRHFANQNLRESIAVRVLADGAPVDANVATVLSELVVLLAERAGRTRRAAPE